MLKQKLQKQTNEKFGWSENRFNDAWEGLNNIPCFAADGNVHDVAEMTEDEHRLMRSKVEHYLAKAFDAMKIVMDDNLKETPKRIAKVWCGDSLHCDTELGGGRFSKPVRIPTFPNTRGDDKWITKEVRIVATCSHHFLPFTGKATISYRPGQYVLGISKLQRLANYVANRFWLQEDLTKALHEAVRAAANVISSDVRVEIVAQHGCEKDRGVKNLECNFITNE